MTESSPEELSSKDAMSVSGEKRLRLYEAILSATPDFVYTFDLNHRIIYANAALLKMWGKTWEQAIGKSFLEIGYEPWHAAMHGREIDQVAATMQPLRGEVPFNGTAGRRIYDYIFVPVIGADGKVEAVAGTTRDVTENKVAEEQLTAAKADAEAASKAKDRFLAALSHELRTPLNPVLLLATDAERNLKLPKEIRGDFATIRRNVELEARLIDDLLDLTRISSGKLRLVRQALDVHELLHACMRFVGPDVEAKGLKLELSFQVSDPWIEADPVRLQQIFWNVLRNAVKFTPENGAIYARTRMEDGSLVLEVQDTGIGIGSAELTTIFEAFHQGAGGGGFGGLGLGLAITRALVEEHGGRISARSDGTGLGSTFRLEFPLVSVPAPGDSAMDRQTEVPAPSPSIGRRILLVEDHEDTRETLQRLLVRRGHQVSPAGNLRGARALAAGSQFDFVITDIGLPDGDGTELMAMFAGAERVPMAIALTGYGMEEDVQRTLAAGFFAHLTKPINFGELEQLLGRR